MKLKVKWNVYCPSLPVGVIYTYIGYSWTNLLVLWRLSRAAGFSTLFLFLDLSLFLSLLCFLLFFSPVCVFLLCYSSINASYLTFLLKYDILWSQKPSWIETNKQKCTHPFATFELTQTSSEHMFTLFFYLYITYLRTKLLCVSLRREIEGNAHFFPLEINVILNVAAFWSRKLRQAGNVTLAGTRELHTGLWGKLEINDDLKT